MKVATRAAVALAGVLVVLAGACVPMAAAAAAAEDQVFYRYGPIEVLGDGRHALEVGVGLFDVLSGDRDPDRSLVGRVEFRFGDKSYFLGPAIGLMANADGGVFGYGAVYADVVYGNIVATPFLGFGGYAEGTSKDLGGVFQFLAGVAAAYALPDGSRLGVRAEHISNAEINETNNGAEVVSLTYAVPF